MSDEVFNAISKDPVSKMTVRPNLDLEQGYKDFSWETMYQDLDWLPGGGLNKAHEAIDRHANGANKNKIAMIWEGKNGEREDYTFHDLKLLTNQSVNNIVHSTTSIFFGQVYSKKLHFCKFQN